MNRASLIALLVVAILWEVVTRSFDVPRYIFPSLSAIGLEVANHADIFVSNTVRTTIESVLGAVLGCIVGLALGCVMALSRTVERVILPYVIGSNSVPVVAIAPLVALWFGHGLLSKVLVAAFLCFFPIAINTYEGLRDRGGVLKELFTIIAASPVAYFWKLRVPLAVPFVLAGTKISVVLAVIGAVVAEFVGSDAGLGFGMVQASYSLNTPRLFGYMIVSCLLGLLFYGIALIAEASLRLSHRWDWVFGSRD
jgi:ABC-type nitrate/sulfonate/bicarbonate transport system permease component